MRCRFEPWRRLRHFLRCHLDRRVGLCEVSFPGHRLPRSFSLFFTKCFMVVLLCCYMTIFFLPWLIGYKMYPRNNYIAIHCCRVKSTEVGGGRVPVSLALSQEIREIMIHARENPSPYTLLWAEENGVSTSAGFCIVYWIS